MTLFKYLINLVGIIDICINRNFQDISFKVYTNPFNEYLKFEFESAEAVHAKIEIYDLTGRRVETIFDVPIESNVNYNVEFKPKTVISAFYMYRMVMGEAIYYGKVVYKKE